MLVIVLNVKSEFRRMKVVITWLVLNVDFNGVGFVVENTEEDTIKSSTYLDALVNNSQIHQERKLY